MGNCLQSAAGSRRIPMKSAKLASHRRRVHYLRENTGGNSTELHIKWRTSTSPSPSPRNSHRFSEVSRSARSFSITAETSP